MRAAARRSRCAPSPECPLSPSACGEKLDVLEVFHPDRLASRILGMGDMLGLIEKAVKRSIAPTLERMGRKRLVKGDFNLEDFSKQLQQLKKMGPLHADPRDDPGCRQTLPRTCNRTSPTSRCGAPSDHQFDDGSTNGVTHADLNGSRKRRRGVGSVTIPRARSQ